MAFYKHSTLSPHGAPVKLSRVIANSITVTEMDSMKMASGFCALGTTGALVFGHVLAIGSSKGVGLNTTGATGAEMGSYINTFTTASNNQTVGFVKAECDVSKFTLYSAEVDAAIGTTTGSNLPGFTQDLADEDTLDESTAVATTGQYMGHGVDPSRTTHALVNIFESQVFGV
jgi:hypothetical protein